jgi:phosphatidylglycerophosphatase A
MTRTPLILCVCVACALILPRVLPALAGLRLPTRRDLRPSPRLPVATGRRARVAYALATWFGCGYAPLAPGTVGTLGAVPLYVLARPLGPWTVLALAVVCTFASVWSASVVCDHTGLKDPQVVVIDEVAGVLFTLAATPPTLAGTVAAIVAFRLFDQLKPWPAYVAERDLPSGWGVTFDDVFAGAWGAATMAFLVRVGAL